MANPHVPDPYRIEKGPPLTVSIKWGLIWVSAAPSAEPHVAWRMPAHGPVEDLELSHLPGEDGFRVVFRQADVTWKGELDRMRRPTGVLRAMDADGG